MVKIPAILDFVAIFIFTKGVSTINLLVPELDRWDEISWDESDSDSLGPLQLLFPRWYGNGDNKLELGACEWKTVPGWFYLQLYSITAPAFPTCKEKNMFFLAYFTLVPRTTQTQVFLCQYNHMYLCYAGTLTCKHHRRVIKDNSFPVQHCSTKHFQRSCTLGKEDKIYIPIRPHGRNMHQHLADAFML